MNEHQSYLRLMAWLSPVFPTGGFAYSSGLERACHDGFVNDENGLYDWLFAQINHGSFWNDLVIFGQSWRLASNDENIAPMAELCEAMAGTKERHMETITQGTSFLKAAQDWADESWSDVPDHCPLPVAIGVRCADCAISLETALIGYLNSFITNQLQAAIRLSILGQTGAAKLLAKFEPEIARISHLASSSNLDDLGSATIHTDILSMKHEVQHSRLFRS